MKQYFKLKYFINSNTKILNNPKYIICEYILTKELAVTFLVFSVSNLLN